MICLNKYRKGIIKYILQLNVPYEVQIKEVK